MKRPPQVWLLATLGILLLFHTCDGLRATSLIFAKTTTTTTTTEAPAEEEVVTTSSETTSNDTSTKASLTGIPQIDYIWDPNLPRELNGFNLTDYPFYETIPKEIDFKCDGLHDGFYASVPHKCQVYHHCLFGTRYDFLCANYTAFDQKTFICHFVSEVDCINSPKYFHRNDALYKAATTTTTTTLAPVTPRPTPTSAPPRRLAAPGRRRRPLRRRRPYDEYYDDEYDYETDRERDYYYDEPRYQATEAPRNDGRRRRKRPRPSNRRPEYEEDYEVEYEDERFDRRGSGRRDEDRRPYDRRPSKKDPKYDDEDHVQDDRRRPEKKPDDRRRPVEDDYDRRPYNRKTGRRPVEDDRYDDENRRPYDRRKEDEDRRYRPEDKDDRRYDRPRKNEDDERRYRPKDTKQEEEPRRYRPKEDKPPTKEEPKALVRPSSGSSVYDRPRAPPIIRRPVPLNERDKFDYKPTAKTNEKASTSIEEEYYDDYEEELPKPSPKTTRKPDVEPQENDRRSPFRSKNRQTRPYKPEEESRKPPRDYEGRASQKRPVEEIDDTRRPSKRPDDFDESRRPSKRPIEDPLNSRRSQKRPIEDELRRPQKRPVEEEVRRPQKRPVEEEGTRRPQKTPVDDEDLRRPSKRPFDTPDDIRRPTKRPGLKYEERTPSLKHSDEDFVDDDYESKSREELPQRPLKYSPREKPPEIPKPDTTVDKGREPIVRVVKRPFLPSRGGSPYVSRGLQPIGAKALDPSIFEPNDSPKSAESKSEQTSSKQIPSSEEQYEYEEEIKPTRKEEPSIEDIFKPVTTRPKTDFRQNFRSESPFRSTAEPKTTTPKPRQADNYRNPLDINENEYDVTLNDALNPTIPNLPIRSVPTGFGTGRDGYTNYQRPRFIAIEAPLSSASSDYVYDIKDNPRGHLQGASSNPGYASYVRQSQSPGYQGQNYRHPSTASGQYYNF